MSIQNIMAGVGRINKRRGLVLGALTFFTLLTITQNKHHCTFGASSYSNALPCCTLAQKVVAVMHYRDALWHRR